RVGSPGKLRNRACEEVDAGEDLLLRVADGARRAGGGSRDGGEQIPGGAAVDVGADGLGQHEVVVARAAALDDAPAPGIEDELARLADREPVALDRGSDPHAPLRAGATLEVDGNEELGFAHDALASER